MKWMNWIGAAALILGLCIPCLAQIHFADGTEQNTAFPGANAAGTDATIAGGTGNTANGTAASTGGGASNGANANYTTVAGGRSNTGSGSYAAVGGGYSNAATKYSATVGGGYDNTASGLFATIAGGYLNSASGDSASVGGGYYNQASADYATIAGGGPADLGNLLTSNNVVTDDYGAIGGGGGNLAGDAAGTTEDATYATVAGGYFNFATASGATIGGGHNNHAFDGFATIAGGYANTASGSLATVGGGQLNVASAEFATVSGGDTNIASERNAVVGGGFENTASKDHATVGGGIRNAASGAAGTVGGGSNNVAEGQASTVPGGNQCEANAAVAFATGLRAKADHDGTTVFADLTDADFHSSVANEFSVRSTGGARFFTNSALTAGVTLAAGGSSWASVSTRESKDNFEETDVCEVLEKVTAMPILTWNYKAQDPSIRHMGPMAEDFRAAFSVGDFPDRITGIDADGVALAAIQGLNKKVEEKEAAIASLSAQLKAVLSQNLALEARLTALEQDAGTPVHK